VAARFRPTLHRGLHPTARRAPRGSSFLPRAAAGHEHSHRRSRAASPSPLPPQNPRGEVESWPPPPPTGAQVQLSAPAREPVRSRIPKAMAGGAAARVQAERDSERERGGAVRPRATTPGPHHTRATLAPPTRRRRGAAGAEGAAAWPPMPRGRRGERPGGRGGCWYFLMSTIETQLKYLS